MVRSTKDIVHAYSKASYDMEKELERHGIDAALSIIFILIVLLIGFLYGLNASRWGLTL